MKTEIIVGRTYYNKIIKRHFVLLEYTGDRIILQNVANFMIRSVTKKNFQENFREVK